MSIKTPVVLFRSSYDTEKEYEICSKYVKTVSSRSDCRGDLIIGRYSCLPYYRELEYDLANTGCLMINTLWQHEWIANFEYYDQLKEYTFETWNRYDFPDCKYEGPFVVKGKTNSKKHQWDKLMFAKTKREAIEIGIELSNDGLVGQQDIIYRKFVLLKNYGYGIHGLPFSEEWRFFFLGNKMLSYGYYWTCAEDVEKRKVTQEGINFAQKIADMVWNTEIHYANFFVLDIAEKKEGGWILVEINDGQQSGLSENNPEVLYSNLAKECERFV
jgi:hypothetical protein